MPSKEDIQERKLTSRMFLVLAATIIILGAVIVFIVMPMVATAVAPGLGLKPAAVVSFVVTLVSLVIMMVAAGDGLLGEIQYTLPAFLAFFVIVWLLLAWVF